MGEIGWQDIRLVAGEGKLTAQDVFAAVNVILKRRDDQRDEYAKLLERLEATDKLEWADESGVAVNAILADFRTLIAKGK